MCFGTGRETAFATLFGGMVGLAPAMSVAAGPNASGVLVMPQPVPFALSTDEQLSA